MPCDHCHLVYNTVLEMDIKVERDIFRVKVTMWLHSSIKCWFKPSNCFVKIKICDSFLHKLQKYSVSTCDLSNLRKYSFQMGSHNVTQFFAYS
jgi:hypothetical protein